MCLFVCMCVHLILLVVLTLFVIELLINVYFEYIKTLLSALNTS